MTGLLYDQRPQLAWGKNEDYSEVEFGLAIDGVFNKYIASFYKKVRSPPYYCAVFLDPSLKAWSRLLGNHWGRRIHYSAAFTIATITQDITLVM